MADREGLGHVHHSTPTPARRPGTLVYAVHRDRDDPDVVVMHELYASDAALDAHGATDAAATFGAVLGDLLAEEPAVWFSRPWRADGVPAAGPAPPSG